MLSAKDIIESLFSGDIKITKRDRSFSRNADNIWFVQSDRGDFVCKLISEKEANMTKYIQNNHPDIIPPTVFRDLGDQNGCITIQRKFVDLVDYLNEVENHHDTLEEVIATMHDIVEEAARIIGLLNSFGIHHNDVKFDNFVIDPETGSIYLIDFEESDFSKDESINDKRGLERMWEEFSSAESSIKARGLQRRL